MLQIISNDIAEYHCSYAWFVWILSLIQFSLSPNQNSQKRKVKTIQYRKSTIWETKEAKYAKKKPRQKWGLYDITYAKSSGKFLRKFTKPCRETPSWCPFEGKKYDGRKPKKASVFEFSYKIVNTSLKEFIKKKVIFIPRQGMFR